MQSRGYRVSFQACDGSSVTLPWWWVIAMDKDGEHIRRCDILIVPLGQAIPLGETTPRDRALAADLNGGAAGLQGALVDVPGPGWVALKRVQRIFYEWRGEPWQHPYDPPVTLYEHRFVPAFKVRLPDGCDVSGRGFVWP